MLALALSPRDEEAERWAWILRDKQGHRIHGALEELDLSLPIGHLHLIGSRGAIVEEGGEAVWLDNRTPASMDFKESVLKADSPGDLMDLLLGVDGFYAGVKISKDSIIFFRDHAGVAPLNIAVRRGLVLAASERLSLGPYAEPVKPGNLILFNGRELGVERWYRPRQLNLRDPVSYLAERLKEFLKTYMPKSYSLAFSGGLDSSVIALASIHVGRRVEAVVVGVEGCRDIGWAAEAADILGLKVKELIVGEEELLRVLTELLKILPNRSAMDLSLASIFYTASETSQSKILVTGQGADESFGGYKKYVEAFGRLKPEEVNGMILNDLENLYLTNLERDEIACSAAGAILIPPYLGREIHELSLSIGLEMKLRRADDRIVRKWILRKAGEALGLPKKLVERPKKAAQYGSGILRLVRRLMREGLITPVS